MKMKWYGTATIEYSAPGGRLLVDPFVPLPGSKHRVDISEYDGYSDILVSHGHFDHIVSIPEIIRRNPGTHVYCTQTPYETLLKKGVPPENMVTIHYGDRMQIGGFTVTFLHGKHAVLPKASPKTVMTILKRGNRKNLPFIIRENRLCPENDETVMFLIEADGKRILHMGSMNLREDTEYPRGCDLLMLPYNGWEDNFPPAVRVIGQLDPEKVILHHFDNTFPPVTSEPVLGPVLERFGDRIRVPEYKVVETA